MSRVVGAALHRRVVADHDHLAARDAPDSGDDAGAGCVIVVESPGRKRGEFEEGRATVEQQLDALPNRQLPLRAMPFHRLRTAALAVVLGAGVEFGDEAAQSLLVGPEDLVGGGDARLDDLHPPGIIAYGPVRAAYADL